MRIFLATALASFALSFSTSAWCASQSELKARYLEGCHFEATQNLRAEAAAKNLKLKTATLKVTEVNERIGFHYAWFSVEAFDPDGDTQTLTTLVQSKLFSSTCRMDQEEGRRNPTKSLAGAITKTLRQANPYRDVKPLDNGQKVGQSSAEKPQ